jgi:hypothetical protein
VIWRDESCCGLFALLALASRRSVLNLLALLLTLLCCATLALLL